MEGVNMTCVHHFYLSPVSHGVSHAVCKLCGAEKDMPEPRIYLDYNNKSHQVIKVKPKTKQDKIDKMIAEIMNTPKSSYKPRATRYISD